MTHPPPVPTEPAYRLRSISDWWFWATSPWRQTNRAEFDLYLLARIHSLEELIMTTAENLVARLDAATTEIAGDIADVKAALAAALAGADAAVVAAVTAELAKLDAPIARLESLGADPVDPIPAPPVEDPAPVEPDPAV